MWTKLLDYCFKHRKCAKFLSCWPAAANHRRAVLLIALVTVLILAAVTTSRAAATWFSTGRATTGLPSAGVDKKTSSSNPSGKNSTSSLYECELSYLQLDLSLIKFSINYLDFDEPQVKDNDGNDDYDGNGKDVAFKLAQIEYNSTIDELAANTKLNARLPFVFFINGFNTFAPYEEINSTWMYEVARSFARRRSQAPASSKRGSTVAGPGTSPGSGSGSSSGGLGASARQECGFLARIQRFISARLHAGRSSSSSPDDDADGMEADETAAPDSESPGSVPFANGRNVIFLTWSIPDLFASNLFAMIPAYYKTVANYDLIVDYVSGTILKFIVLVEQTNKFKTEEARSRYYAQFQFYGHSLGSHILSDAISRVVSELTIAAADSGTTALAKAQPLANSLLSAMIPTARPFGLPVARLPTKPMKFGKLMGLDPASPCFVSLEYGISSSKVSEAVNEVVVLHSNAGFAGIPNERANLEIVLNGGTFQPGCVWYDFTCSHVRSTDILSYVDDECQMVAYRCTSYNHFKQGACETCSPTEDYTTTASSLENNNSKATASSSLLERNCILVNLPEQHRDKPDVLAYAEQMSNRTRQLAEATAEDTTIASGAFSPKQLNAWLTTGSESSKSITNTSTAETGAGGDEAKVRKANYFHYVNTNANFRFGRKSHCLQHYQLRLLIYNEDLRLREKCKLSSFYIKSSDEIKLKLFYETASSGLDDSESLVSLMNGRQAWPQFGGTGPRPSGLGRHRYRSSVGQGARTQQQQQRGPALVAKFFSDADDPRIMSDQIKLGAVIKDVFHTALVNFEDSAKLFVGAQIGNLDLVAMGECYKRENATSGPKFVLDTAFMSHTNQKIRNAYSSVLCGQLELQTPGRPVKEPKNDDSRSDSSTPTGPGSSSSVPPPILLNSGDLMLNLCKQSELKTVSAEIDKLLNQIKLHLLDETWKVSLLNSLFSLFTEWEPF